MRRIEEGPEWTDPLIQTLLNALRERDPYTYGHSRRVARYSRLLAQAAGLNEFEQRVIETSSLFHDLGKLGIPDSVLLKPGRLTPAEEAIMRAHPVKSAEILAPLAHVPFFRATLPGVRHHHERVDGGGYPDGIQGDNIPLAARMILIVDTFDAMTTTRPYRQALTVEHAFKELQLFAGRQFDPHLVKVFIDAQPTWHHTDEEISAEFIASKFRRAA